MVVIINNSLLQSVPCRFDETMVIITLHYPQLINAVKMLRRDVNNLQLHHSIVAIQGIHNGSSQHVVQRTPCVIDSEIA